MVTKKQIAEAESASIIAGLNEELSTLNKKKGFLNDIFNTQLKNEEKLKKIATEKRLEEAKLLIMKSNAADYSKDDVENQLKSISNKEKELELEKKSIENKGSMTANLTKSYWYQNATLKVLNDQDKVIRQTILNLGLSGIKALEMRRSFESAASDAFLLGANLEDILKIQTGFADETGRAQVLTNDMVKDVILIGKGTAIGIEQAAKLGSQFQLMGIDTKRTMEYVQGVVDTSERMGINTAKVLNNIANNFKKLQTMSFTTGVQGYAKMAQYAEKMKMDMVEAIQSNKMANNLEKSIDLASQLQVMGGEFAKVDPFQMLYLSRNAPDEFAKRMNEMTKGLVTFRNMADGTFQKFISPADRDRLESVAKSTGMSVENLTEQALRMADVDKMKQMMLGKGFSSKDKELITGQSMFDTKLGKYLVKIGEVRKDITKLTAEDIKTIQLQQSLLETRAQDALTFNESLESMVSALKSTLLPLMRGITWVLDKVRGTVQWFTQLFGEGFKTGMGVVGSILGVVLLAQAISKVVVGTINSAKSLVVGLTGGKFLGGGGVSNGAGGGAGRFLGAGSAKGLMQGGIGIGAAGLGVGAGFGMASYGIGSLANSLSKLTDKQAETLKSVVTSLSWLMGIGVGVAGAVAVLGSSTLAAAGGLAIFSAVVLAIGSSVWIASKGLSSMADSFSNLMDSSKGAGESFSAIGSSISTIGLNMFKMGAFSDLLDNIAEKSEKISMVGDSFKKISTILSSSKDDFIAIESAINAISNLNTSKDSAFSQLADLLNKPLKVQFADKNVNVVSNITLEIDGVKFMEKVYKAPAAITANIEARRSS
jgi:hypothetical protein